jgi:hypothetical protein
MWKKKKRCFICVTIVRNWLFHWGLIDTIPGPGHYTLKDKRVSSFVKIATSLQHSFQTCLGE